jgi:prolyl oligopeptidase PreP (S9A serine peptidase family)
MVFLFSVSDAGSDWSTIYFMDVASRKKLDDVIVRTKFASLRWTTDNRGVFYTTYAGALDNEKKIEDANETKKKDEVNTPS